MKLLVVGDTHGSNAPLSIAKEKESEVDKIVFLGDYVDSFDNYWPTQKKVLTDILNFKQQCPKKVDLLLGNHDIEYFKPCSVFCLTSGHQHKYHADIYSFFKEYEPLFDVVSIEGFWVCSHAGISTTWLDNPIGPDYRNYSSKNSWSLTDINTQFHEGNYKCFEHNSRDPYGNDVHESCMWIRPPALLEKGVGVYNQVVGHTEFLDPIIPNYWGINNRIVTTKNDTKVVFIDSQGRNVYTIIDTNNNNVEVNTYVTEKTMQ